MTVSNRSPMGASASGRWCATPTSRLIARFARAIPCSPRPQGDRRVPLLDLCRLPGDEPQRDTVLEHSELITAVDLSPLPFATRSHYRKVRDRASYAFALVSVAAALDVAGGVVRDVHIALGGVAHVPWRAVRAEAALRGTPATQEAFGRAAEAELANAQ